MFGWFVSGVVVGEEFEDRVVCVTVNSDKTGLNFDAVIGMSLVLIR